MLHVQDADHRTNPRAILKDIADGTGLNSSPLNATMWHTFRFQAALLVSLSPSYNMELGPKMIVSFLSLYSFPC